jgi:hypothetical protein
MLTKARKQYQRRFNEEKYARVNLVIPKTNHLVLDRLNNLPSGESKNSYIIGLVYRDALSYDEATKLIYGFKVPLQYILRNCFPTEGRVVVNDYHLEPGEHNSNIDDILLQVKRGEARVFATDGTSSNQIAMVVSNDGTMFTLIEVHKDER